ncbi:Uma2 family endonuclease [Laspinema olomoucense]|uniref:Uma2 family endonuclease n=1 Tax=Laspinema olomoucense D3b TaxID=2953688 RepID=A0ABT2NGQ4_9CYAN|nr:Uma2 family endonuclease [Laspinema sp. D3b]MCT7981059.1 Uma2 family endonuclease [Laspinema sp. D3b]
MVQTPISSHILYPDSDGKPIAENTLQYRWIVRLVTNLKQLLKEQVAFVAGDLLWYPVRVERPPAPCQAPDAMVVWGRPDGDRGSYKQWEEDNIAPQVVFEILSPSNTMIEMAAKQNFYAQYGVLEMVFYDPQSHNFWGLHRATAQDSLNFIQSQDLPWISPLLNIRFELSADGLAVYHPDGELFKEPGELYEERDKAQQERDKAFAKLRELGIDPETL